MAVARSGERDVREATVVGPADRPPSVQTLWSSRLDPVDPRLGRVSGAHPVLLDMVGLLAARDVGVGARGSGLRRSARAASVDLAPRPHRYPLTRRSDRTDPVVHLPDRARLQSRRAFIHIPTRDVWQLHRAWSPAEGRCRGTREAPPARSLGASVPESSGKSPVIEEVEAGVTSREQAQARFDEYVERVRAEGGDDDIDVIGRRVRAAVEAGEITEEEARAEMAAVRERLAARDDIDGSESVREEAAVGEEREDNR